MKNANVTINRPIYAGACILDLSKVEMYEFFYGFLKPKCGENFSLLYHDTDCFFLEFRGCDIYEIIKKNYDFFDTYDYPEDNVFNIERKNNKLLGKFKDEAKGTIITKFCGLRSKMYAWKTRNKITKILKGIKRNVVDNKITFENYESALFDNKIYKCTQNTIRSKLHRVYSVKEKKDSLNPHDEKRYILNDKISTLAWGHNLIKNAHV